MFGIFKKIIRPSKGPNYNYRKLIARRQKRAPEIYGQFRRHIISDIDKTYLETEFGSVVEMARVALEKASDKVTVAGATEVFDTARWSGGMRTGLHFVSSSPPQLRTVLDRKLAMDGLDWDSDTFKNQAYNVLSLRLDQLRQHVAYKTAAVFDLIGDLKRPVTIYLVGDSAEFDSYIFTGVYLYLSKRLSAPDYVRYLEFAGVEFHIAEELVTQLSAAGELNVEVGGIYIREAPRHAFSQANPLARLSHRFRNYLELSFNFMHDDLIEGERVWELLRTFHNIFLYSRERIEMELLAHKNLLAARPSIQEAVIAAHERFNFDKTLMPAFKEDFLDARAPFPSSKAYLQDMTSAWTPTMVLEAADAWSRSL